MRYRISLKSFTAPLVLGVIAGALLGDVAAGLAVFAFFLMIPIIKIYIPYAKDNPENLWFKRKIYGWGWVPVTWQGWVVTFGYVALVAMFSLTIDENSPVREIVFTFGIPFVLLTIAFFRILYRKGEKPRWQWGVDERDHQKEIQ